MNIEMKNIKIRKSLIIAVALSGAIINAVYSVDILRTIFDPQYNNAIREIMISAVVLEIGWITLLVWVINNPFERRSILLFTIVPILLGNIFHGVNQFGTHSGKRMGNCPKHGFRASLFRIVYCGVYGRKK
jgi:hypothetical protein